MPPAGRSLQNRQCRRNQSFTLGSGFRQWSESLFSQHVFLSGRYGFIENIGVNPRA
jgi:hypothetical protein